MPTTDPAATTKPKVLFVYYTYTNQSPRIIDAMADVLRERGCDVEQAAIAFTDKRWADRFTHHPMKHVWRDVLGMAPPQLRNVTGEIGIPENAQKGDYDLVCFGSPTWFFRPSIPIRSYLKSDAAGQVLRGKRFTAFVVCRRYWSINLRAVKKLGRAQGGDYIDGVRFTFEGRQIPSFMSLISYLGKGENLERYHGMKIPPSLLMSSFTDEARGFANTLADGLAAN